MDKEKPENPNLQLPLPSQIEAILFVAGDGMSVDFLSEKLGVPAKEINNAIEELRQKYDSDSGIQIIKYKNNYQLCTNPALAEQVNSILATVREKNLTRAALETLSIIAYKQPITRLEIDEIRGVASDYSIQILMQNNLIEVLGRKDTVGKPLLFGTTDEFLKRFELADINNLPGYEQLLEKIKIIQTDFDLYNSNRSEDVG